MTFFLIDLSDRKTILYTTNLKWDLCTTPRAQSLLFKRFIYSSSKHCFCHIYVLVLNWLFTIDLGQSRQCPSLVSICLTLRRQCPSFVSVCLTLRRQCPSFVSICLTLRRQCPSFVSVCLTLRRQCPSFVIVC